MAECLAVLEFYAGAISYAEYWAMPGADRRAVVDHLLLRVKRREREQQRARRR